MPKKTTQQRWLWLAVAVAIIVSSAAFLNGYLGQVDKTETAQAEKTQATGEKKAVATDAEALAAQVLAACRTAKGSALKQLRADGLCQQAANTRTTIQENTTRFTNLPASAEQVLAAVSLYCSTRNECRGMTGTSGSDGINGINGGDGTDAPPVTSDQLAATLTAYCAARNECRGPGGSNGSDGAAGASAPVIVSSECDTDNRIVLTLSNGDRIPVSNSQCRVVPVPDPTPTEEVTP